jgi:hypothetical protein
VLEFGDNDVDCERDEFIVFVSVVGELGVETCEVGVEIGILEISKISTISEYPLFELHPPPKNILFVDDVDASQ